MVEIRLHNTKTRQKDTFTPIDPQNVRMYVCGPTVYDRAHLGNARPVVVFDVLFRLLRHVYKGNVTYVRNFTDVDDKINARARELQAAGDTRSLNDIIRGMTDETIGWYHADMDALGALRPQSGKNPNLNCEPRATEFIGAMADDGSWSGMIGMIKTLTNRISPETKKPYAYVEQKHVLFDVRAYPNYGRLSGRSLDDMIAGARVEVAPYKRDPMDFVLWKPARDDEPGWPSPWGRGRPGWHIECSAMSHELLGESFDIHGGGMDLQFPHHENEIAQSCCAHPEGGFANFWLHNEMVQVDGKKMSKSLGNFFTVKDLLDQGWPGEVIRFVMLSTHYRKPMDWTEEKAAIAKRTLTRWYDLTETVVPSLPAGEVKNAIGQDINTADALNFLQHFGQVLWQQRNMLAHDGHGSVSADEHKARLSEFLASAQFLGFLLSREEWVDRRIESLSLNDEKVSQTIAEAVYRRKLAKQDKDFKKADEIRHQLEAAGVILHDKKDGSATWEVPVSLDRSKLDALK